MDSGLQTRNRTTEYGAHAAAAATSSGRTEQEQEQQEGQQEANYYIKSEPNTYGNALGDIVHTYSALSSSTTPASGGDL